MKKIILSICLSFVALFANAQSSPNLFYGQIPTAAQWNSYFSAKQDYKPLITYPASGTLATLAGTESLSNKTLLSPVFTTPTLSGITSSAILKVNASGLFQSAVVSDADLVLPSQATHTGQFLQSNGTSSSWQSIAGINGGTVTSVSVTSANGFAGTVASPTLTPAITLSTSITGVLKGNGTAISAAANSDLPAMTATVGGAVPTPPNDKFQYLRGDGTFGYRVRWFVRSSNYTAVSTDGILADTSGGAFTVTMPASAVMGDSVTIVDYSGTFATNNLIVANNGLKIMGSASNMTISTNYFACTLVYSGATNGWIIAN